MRPSAVSRKLILPVLAGALLSTAGAAEALRRSPLTVAGFLELHNRLSHNRREIPRAYASDLTHRLLRSIQDGLRAALEADSAARAAGRPPLFCGPPLRSFGVNIEEVHEHILTLAPEQRTLLLSEAILGVVQKRYPCPASQPLPEAGGGRAAIQPGPRAG